ncbi:MAG TPA: MarC family protein [Acetobacteraceae bacterium]|nr:MarC family protein [Acetobacteraceae bacterium]
MITPAFMFTIFMLTLGPIKTVPAFFAMTRNDAPPAMRSLAVRGTVAATVISLVIAFVMTAVAASWRLSPDDIRIAGGILLFGASRETIGQIGRSASSPFIAPATHPSVTPLAVPIIVTPWGVTAILFFVELAQGDPGMSAIVIAALLLTMLLNLLGMLLARWIIACAGMIGFQVVGWIFAVMQAGLAVDSVITSLRHLGVFHPAS